MTAEKRLEQLEQRLNRVEAELEIRNLITRYSLAVDCGDTEAAVACHTPDAVYVVSAPGAGRSADEQDLYGQEDLRLEGHQAIAAMVDSPLHRSLLPDCAHTVGPFRVTVEVNRAAAVGYSRLYRQQQGAVSLMRLSINQWYFQRQAGQWYIAYRESRVLGSEEARQILKQQ